MAARSALEAIRGPSEEQLRSQALTRRLKSALLAEDYAGVAVLVMEGASTSLGEALREGIERMRWQTQQAAEQGNPAAQFLVGTLHFLGHGVPKDLAKAVRWWRRSAEQGNAQAQTNLGRMYYDGDGIEKDQVKAVKWFRRAAEQGDSSGQNNLAVAYMTGNGTDQSKAEAIKWFRRAAEQRNLSAQLALGRVYHTGEGVEQDKAEAVLWYGKAAERGNATAQRILGAASSDGDGVRQDKTEAAKWSAWPPNREMLRRDSSLVSCAPMARVLSRGSPRPSGGGAWRPNEGHPGGRAMLSLKPPTPREGVNHRGRRPRDGSEGQPAGKRCGPVILGRGAPAAGMGLRKARRDTSAGWRVLGNGPEDAQYNKAVMAIEGQGVDKDRTEAAECVPQGS